MAFESSSKALQVIHIIIPYEQLHTLGEKHCEALHFKQFDITFRLLQHIFLKVLVIFFKN